MRTIGITGRSGCGKSQVTAFLRSQGCFVADADLVARQILMDGSPCIPQLTERFGADILDEEGTCAAACWPTGRLKLPRAQRRSRALPIRPLWRN